MFRLCDKHAHDVKCNQHLPHNAVTDRVFTHHIYMQHRHLSTGQAPEGGMRGGGVRQLLAVLIYTKYPVRL